MLKYSLFKYNILVKNYEEINIHFNHIIDSYYLQCGSCMYR